MPENDSLSQLTPEQMCDLCALADGSIADDRRAAVALAVWSPWSGSGEPTVANAAQLASRGSDRPAPAATGVRLTQLAAAVGDVEFPNWYAAFGWRPAGLRRDRLDGRGATTVFY